MPAKKSLGNPVPMQSSKAPSRSKSAQRDSAQAKLARAKVKLRAVRNANKTPSGYDLPDKKEEVASWKPLKKPKTKPVKENKAKAVIKSSAALLQLMKNAQMRDATKKIPASMPMKDPRTVGAPPGARMVDGRHGWRTKGWSSRLVVFPHRTPQEYSYYFMQRPHRPGVARLLVGITSYNEEGRDLESTLESLLRQKNLAHRGADGIACELAVVIVADGVFNIAPSMRASMARIFDAQSRAGPGSITRDKPAWDDHTLVPVRDFMEMLTNFENEGTEKDTAICERYYEDSAAEFDWGTVSITAIIKHGNRKKHNSHEWYLKGFALWQRSQFTVDHLLLTDVGTRFEQDCLGRLTRRQYEGGHCAVVGFMRPRAACTGAPISYIIGAVQRFEFYAAFASVVAAFALLAGFQPCIPGPCQMVAADDALNPRFLDRYFVSLQGKSTSLLEANMKLAEDRLFSNFLYCESGRSCGFEPRATYEIDLEVSPKQFFLQRRRWVNGGIGCTIMALLRFNEWFDKSFGATSWVIWFMMVWYSLLPLAAAFAPGVLAGCMFLAVDSWKTHDMQYPIESLSPEGHGVIAGALLLFSTFGFVISSFYHEFNRVAFMWCFAVMVSASLFIITWLILNTFFLTGGTDYASVFWLLIVFKILGIIATVLFAVLFLKMTAHSVIAITWCHIMYMMFSSLYIMAIGYSVARSGDLSWGTRPDAAKGGVLANVDNLVKGVGKKEGSTYLITYVVGNICVAIIISLLGYYTFDVVVFIIAVMLLSLEVFFYVCGLLFSLEFLVRSLCFGGRRSAKVQVKGVQNATEGRAGMKQRAFAK